MAKQWWRNARDAQPGKFVEQCQVPHAPAELKSGAGSHHGAHRAPRNFITQTTCWPSSSGSIRQIPHQPIGEPTTVGLADIFGKLACCRQTHRPWFLRPFWQGCPLWQSCLPWQTCVPWQTCKGDDVYSNVELIGNVVFFCKNYFSLDDSLSSATPISLANLSPCCRSHLWQSSLPGQTCWAPLPWQSCHLWGRCLLLWSCHPWTFSMKSPCEVACHSEGNRLQQICPSWWHSRPWRICFSWKSCRSQLSCHPWQLGWEFQFLVPISGIPIVSGILIPCSIPKFPVIFFLKFQFLESQKIGILICNIWNSGNFFAQELSMS